MAYGPVPWQMITRTLAIWYRLADPAEAQQYSHPSLQIDTDPIMRARFWDIRHDAGRVGDNVTLREASVGFPVQFGADKGDDTVFMFATDPAYTAFGREMMGWPVVHGDVSIEGAEQVTASVQEVLSSWPTAPGANGRYWAEPSAGEQFSGTLIRDGRTLMHMRLQVSAPLSQQELQRHGPQWITHRFLPDVSGTSTVDQLILTAPTQVEWGSVWQATGELEFVEAPGSELHYLAPREIVRAEYWCNLRIELGMGRVLHTSERNTLDTASAHPS